MKNFIKHTLLCCGLLGTPLCKAQVNLVPNPSFEDTVSCPFSFGLEAYVQNWKSARATPDYFNSCATWPGASVPSNDYGHQSAYFGNAYIGMLTYRSDSSLYTEAIGVQLSQALQVGIKYYVSFRLSLALENSTGSLTANNMMGIQFATGDYSPTSQIPVNNFAHIWTDSIITDSLNWTTISSSFVADSSYSYLYLGNFFDKPFVDSIVYGLSFGAYYYFDNVCVSTDSLTCNQILSNTNEMRFDLSVFNIHPNPVIDYFSINKNQISPYDLVIYNRYGSKVYEEKNISINTKLIDARIFDKGLLLVNIKTKNKNFNYKLLKP